jgi:hypothetical protein
MAVIPNTKTKQRIPVGVVKGTTQTKEMNVNADGDLIVDTDQTGPTTLLNGVSDPSAASTAAPIVSSSTPVAKGAFVLADPANTETIYVGATGLTIANGQPLAPGVGISISINDVQKIFFIDSGTAGQKVRWIGG